MRDVPPVDAVDAEGYLNTLSLVFLIGSLGVIVFFLGRASAVSLAILGWWVSFVGAAFLFAPATISGSEDVAGWAMLTGWTALLGLLIGGAIGSLTGVLRSSPRFLVICAVLGAIVGAAFLKVYWLLSDVSCTGRVSASHRKQGFERDTTFCTGNYVLGRWNIVYVATVVGLILITAARARWTRSAARGRPDDSAPTASDMV
jgi:hypothetical protein